MTDSWIPKETTTHQDHVTAHVLGASVLGYFVFDEALYLLLDIGFIWTIFLDGEMTLLPHPVAINELELDVQTKDEIKADIDVLLSDKGTDQELLRLKLPPYHGSSGDFAISELCFFEQEAQRRLLLNCGDGTLAIETSLETGEIQVSGLNNKDPEDEKPAAAGGAP